MLTDFKRRMEYWLAEAKTLPEGPHREAASVIAEGYATL